MTTEPTITCPSCSTEIKLTQSLGRWARGLLARAHKNVVVVALANKLARIAWAVLTHGCTYDAGCEAAAT